MSYVLDPPIEPVTVYDPPVISDYVPPEDLFQWIEPTLTPPETVYDFGGETDPEFPSLGDEAELQPDLAYYVEADVDLVVGAPSESRLVRRICGSFLARKGRQGCDTVRFRRLLAS